MYFSRSGPMAFTATARSSSVPGESAPAPSISAVSISATIGSLWLPSRALFRVSAASPSRKSRSI